MPFHRLCMLIFQLGCSLSLREGGGSHLSRARFTFLSSFLPLGQLGVSAFATVHRKNGCSDYEKLEATLEYGRKQWYADFSAPSVLFTLWRNQPSS